MNDTIWMRDDRLLNCVRVECINSVIVKFAVIYFDLISLHFKTIRSIANASHSFFLCALKHKYSFTKSHFILNKTAFSLVNEKMCLIFMLNHHSKLWKDPHASYTFTALEAYQRREKNGNAETLTKNDNRNKKVEEETEWWKCFHLKSVCFWLNSHVHRRDDATRIHSRTYTHTRARLHTYKR